ncbi:epoxide hydrolase family protein [Sphingomonas pokkalii]|uniref:Epoxide hydrolase n=1 Tax=Sphingomonas pokkalii TaxID=2175090 RepID=A0A2U0SBC4_9SPHN|nr:epoxide hydrolase family protein [Sphingomonas pokkalii]PVX28640.1 epoxide hydrolase [Sphingomonas pokkalii]
MPTAVPFTIAIAESRLSWIQDRVRAFPWDSVPDAGGWGAGMAKDTLRRIVDHWANGYDWRAEEAALNGLPQFRAETDQGRLHFVHLRSQAGATRLPILLLHGWPGSFAEFRDVAPRLAHPERFGGTAADAFDLVIPSLPGFAFSDKLRAPIGARTIAGMMHHLMTRTLGYEHYIVQGGDWGSAIGSWIAHDYPQACIGLHLNMAILSHGGARAETEAEKAYRAEQARSRDSEGAYAQLQRTKPQTLGFALEDSPVGAAAWMLEKFVAWSDLPHVDGTPDLEAVHSIDRLLTNVMLYVATGSMTTSTWIYLGNTHDNAVLLEHPVTTPTAVAAFPDPVFSPPPRSLAEKSYNIVRWTPMPRGGHFAAMEQPQAFAADLRTFAETIAAPPKAGTHPSP